MDLKPPHINPHRQPTQLFSGYLFYELLTNQGTNYINVSEKKLPSPHEIVEWFREEGLPVSAISDMIKVQRRSVYSWLKNGSMKSNYQERLILIYELLSENKQAALKYLYHFWNCKIQNGKSLKFFLNQSNLDIQSIKKIISMLWPMAKKYQELREIRKKPSLMKEYFPSANEEEGQLEVANDWEETVADGSSEW